MDATIRIVPTESVYPIRHLILRPNQKYEDCVFPGDALPKTTHFGAYVDDRLIGIASVYREILPQRDNRDGWRIRGMATLEKFRGCGIGGQLLEACIRHVESEGGQLMWCNARTPAATFYRHYGFAAVGDEFDITGIGPHFLMTKELKSV